MAHRLKKIEALKMRRKGLPYSVIKEKLSVSKSTLSVWLRDMPLSPERINALRAKSPQRIERYRNTMKKKRDMRLSLVYEKAKQDIGTLTEREIFLAGLFLYWGEGSKTKRCTITLSNTDPNMIRFYLRWLQTVQVSTEKIKVRLQLYTDMSVADELKYWQGITKLPRRNFRNPYFKKSSREHIHEKGFGHGTCNVIVDNRDISEYILESLKVLGKDVLVGHVSGLRM